MKHQSINDEVPLTSKYFDQWIDLFTGTVDELFKGKHAEIAKQRAKNIAAVMQIKIIPK